MSNDRLMSLSDLSTYTATPKSTLRALIRRGEGPAPMKIGRNLRFDPADVDAWLTDLRRPGRAAHKPVMTATDQNRVAGGVPSGGQYAPTDRPESDVRLTDLPLDRNGSIVQAGGVDVNTRGDGGIELLGWAAGEEQNATSVTPLTREQAQNLIVELRDALAETS